MIVRPATPDDVDELVRLSARVQERLTASGSLQEFGPLARDAVAARVAAGHAHVLDAEGRVLGGVFVEPTPPETSPLLARWRPDDAAGTVWFLSKLMIEPDERGHGYGYRLLDGVRAAVAARGPGMIALDCWAGNDKLRAFYAAAGFALRGVFAAAGYEVAIFTWRTGEGEFAASLL